MKPKLPDIVQYGENNVIQHTNDLNLPKLQLPNVELDPNSQPDNKIKDLLNDINTKPILDVPYEVNMPNLVYDVPSFILPPQDQRSYKEISQMMNAGNELNLGIEGAEESPVVDLNMEKQPSQSKPFTLNTDPNTITVPSENGRVINIVKYIPVPDQQQPQQPQQEIIKDEMSNSDSFAVPELRAKSRNQQEAIQQNGKEQSRQLRPILNKNKQQPEETPDISFQDVVVDPRHWANGPNPKTAVKLPTRYTAQQITETNAIQLMHPKKSFTNPTTKNAVRIPSGQQNAGNVSDIEIDIKNNVQRQTIGNTSEISQQLNYLNVKPPLNDSPAYYEQAATLASPKNLDSGFPILQPKREKYAQEPLSAFESPVPGENEGTYVLRQPVNKVMSYSPIRIPGQIQAPIGQANAIPIRIGNQNISDATPEVEEDNYYVDQNGTVQLRPHNVIQTQQAQQQRIQNIPIEQDNVQRSVAYQKNPQYYQNDIQRHQIGDQDIQHPAIDNYARRIAQGQNESQLEFNQNAPKQQQQQASQQQQTIQQQIIKQRQNQRQATQNPNIQHPELQYQDFEIQNQIYPNQYAERQLNEVEIIPSDGNQVNVLRGHQQNDLDNKYQQQTIPLQKNTQLERNYYQNQAKAELVPDADGTLRYHQFEPEHQEVAFPQHNIAQFDRSQQKYGQISAQKMNPREMKNQQSPTRQFAQQRQQQSHRLNYNNTNQVQGKYSQPQQFNSQDVDVRDAQEAQGSPIRQVQVNKGKQIPIRPPQNYKFPGQQQKDEELSPENIIESFSGQEEEYAHRQPVGLISDQKGQYRQHDSYEYQGQLPEYQDNQDYDPYDNVGYIDKIRQQAPYQDQTVDIENAERLPSKQIQKQKKSPDYQMHDVTTKSAVDNIADDVINTLERQTRQHMNDRNIQNVDIQYQQKEPGYPIQQDFQGNKQQQYDASMNNAVQQKDKRKQKDNIHDVQMEQIPKQYPTGYQQNGVQRNNIPQTSLNPTYANQIKQKTQRENDIPNLDVQAELLQQEGQSIDSSAVRRDYINQVESGYKQTLNQFTKNKPKQSSQYTQQDAQQVARIDTQGVNEVAAQGNRRHQGLHVPQYDGKQQSNKQTKDSNVQELDAYQNPQQEQTKIYKGRNPQEVEQNVLYDKIQGQPQQIAEQQVSRKQQPQNQLPELDLFAQKQQGDNMNVNEQQAINQRQKYDQGNVYKDQIAERIRGPQEEQPSIQDAFNKVGQNTSSDMSISENQSVQHKQQQQTPLEVKQAQRQNEDLDDKYNNLQPQINKLQSTQVKGQYGSQNINKQQENLAGDSPVVQLDGKYVSQQTGKDGYTTIQSETARALTGQNTDSSIKSYQPILDISYPENSNQSFEPNYAQQRSIGNPQQELQQPLINKQIKQPSRSHNPEENDPYYEKVTGQNFPSQNPNITQRGNSSIPDHEVLENINATGQRNSKGQPVISDQFGQNAARIPYEKDKHAIENIYQEEHAKVEQNIPENSNLFVSYVDQQRENQYSDIQIDDLKVNQQGMQIKNTVPKQLGGQKEASKQIYDARTGKAISVQDGQVENLNAHPDKRMEGMEKFDKLNPNNNYNVIAADAIGQHLKQEKVDITNPKNQALNSQNSPDQIQQAQMYKNNLSEQQTDQQSAQRAAQQEHEIDQEDLYVIAKKKQSEQQKHNELYPENYKEYQYDEYDGVQNTAQRQPQRTQQGAYEDQHAQQVYNQPSDYNAPINYIQQLQKHRMQERKDNYEQNPNAKFQRQPHQQQGNITHNGAKQVINQQSQGIQYQDAQRTPGQQYRDPHNLNVHLVTNPEEIVQEGIPKVNKQQSQQIQKLPKGIWNKQYQKPVEMKYDQNGVVIQQDPEHYDDFNTPQVNMIHRVQNQIPNQMNAGKIKQQQQDHQVGSLIPDRNRSKSHDNTYDHRGQFTAHSNQDQQYIQQVLQGRYANNSNQEFNQQNTHLTRIQAQQYHQQFGQRQQPNLQTDRSFSQPYINSYKQQIIQNTKSKGLYNVLNKVKREKLQQNASDISANYEVLGDVITHQKQQRTHKVDSFQFADIVSKKPRSIENQKVTQSEIKKFERENSMFDEEIQSLFPQKLANSPVKTQISKIIYREIPQEYVGFLAGSESFQEEQQVNKQQISQIYDNLINKSQNDQKDDQIKHSQSTPTKLQENKKQVQFLKHSEHDITEEDVDVGKKLYINKQNNPRDIFSTNLPIMEFIAQQELFTDQFVSRITSQQPETFVTHKSFAFTKSQVNDQDYNYQGQMQMHKYSDPKFDQNNSFIASKYPQNIKQDNAQIQRSKVQEDDYLSVQKMMTPGSPISVPNVIRQKQHQEGYQEQNVQKQQYSQEQIQEKELQARQRDAPLQNQPRYEEFQQNYPHIQRNQHGYDTKNEGVEDPEGQAPIVRHPLRPQDEITQEPHILHTSALQNHQKGVKRHENYLDSHKILSGGKTHQNEENVSDFYVRYAEKLRRERETAALEAAAIGHRFLHQNATVPAGIATAGRQMNAEDQKSPNDLILHAQSHQMPNNIDFINSTSSHNILHSGNIEHHSQSASIHVLNAEFNEKSRKDEINETHQINEINQANQIKKLNQENEVDQINEVGTLSRSGVERVERIETVGAAEGSSLATFATRDPMALQASTSDTPVQNVQRSTQLNATNTNISQAKRSSQTSNQDIKQNLIENKNKQRDRRGEKIKEGKEEEQQKTDWPAQSVILHSYVSHEINDNFPENNVASPKKRQQHTQIQEYTPSIVKSDKGKQPDIISQFTHEEGEEQRIHNLSAQSNPQTSIQEGDVPVLTSKSQVTHIKENQQILSPTRNIQQIQQEQDAVYSDFTRIQPSTESESYNEQLGKHTVYIQQVEQYPQNYAEKQEQQPTKKDDNVITNLQKDKKKPHDIKILHHTTERQIDDLPPSPIKETFADKQKKYPKDNDVPYANAERGQKQDDSIQFDEFLIDKQIKENISDAGITIQHPQLVSQKQYQQNIQTINTKLPRKTGMANSVNIVSLVKQFQRLQTSEVNEISLVDQKIEPKSQITPDNIVNAKKEGLNQENDQHDNVTYAQHQEHQKQTNQDTEIITAQGKQLKQLPEQEQVIHTAIKNHQELESSIKEVYPDKQSIKGQPTQEPDYLYPKTQHKQKADEEHILDAKQEDSHNLKVSDIIQNADRREYKHSNEDIHVPLEVQRESVDLMQGNDQITQQIGKITKPKTDESDYTQELQGKLNVNKEKENDVPIQNTTNMKSPINISVGVDKLGTQIQRLPTQEKFAEHSVKATRDQMQQPPVYNANGEVLQEKSIQFGIENLQQIKGKTTDDEPIRVLSAEKNTLQNQQLSEDQQQLDVIRKLPHDNVNYEILNTKNLQNIPQNEYYPKDMIVKGNKQQPQEYDVQENHAKKQNKQQIVDDSNYDVTGLDRQQIKQKEQIIQEYLPQSDVILPPQDTETGILDVQRQIKHQHQENDIVIKDGQIQKRQEPIFNHPQTILHQKNQMPKIEDEDYQYGELVALKAIQNSEFFGSGVGEIQYLNLLQKSLKLIEDSGLRANEVVRSEIEKGISSFSNRDFHVLCAKLELRAPLTDVELFVLQDLVQAEEIKNKKVPIDNVQTIGKQDITSQKSSGVNDVITTLINARQIDRARLSGLSGLHDTLATFNIGHNNKRSKSTSAAEIYSVKKQSLEDEDFSESISVVHIVDVEREVQALATSRSIKDKDNDFEVLNVAGMATQAPAEAKQQWVQKHGKKRIEQININEQNAALYKKKDKNIDVEQVFNVDVKKIEVKKKRDQDDEFDTFGRETVKAVKRENKKEKDENDELNVQIERSKQQKQDEQVEFTMQEAKEVRTLLKHKEEEKYENDSFGELNTIELEKKKEHNVSNDEIPEIATTVQHIPKQQNKYSNQHDENQTVLEIARHKKLPGRSRSASDAGNSPVFLGVKFRGQMMNSRINTLNVVIDKPNNLPIRNEDPPGSNSDPSTSGSSSIPEESSLKPQKFQISLQSSSSFQAIDVVRDVRQCFNELKAFYAKQKQQPDNNNDSNDQINIEGVKIAKELDKEKIQETSAKVNRVKDKPKDDTLPVYHTQENASLAVKQQALTAKKKSTDNENKESIAINAVKAKNNDDESLDEIVIYPVQVEKITSQADNIPQITDTRLQSVVEYVNEDDSGQQVAITAFQRSQIQIPETVQFTKQNTSRVQIGITELRRLKRQDKLELLQQYELQLFPVIVQKLQSIQEVENSIKLTQSKLQKTKSQKQDIETVPINKTYKTANLSNLNNSGDYDTIGVINQDKSKLNKTDLNFNDLNVQKSKQLQEKEDNIQILGTQRNVQFTESDEVFGEPKIYISKALRQLVSTYGNSVNHPIIKKDIEFIQYQYKLLGVDMEDQQQITDQECEILFTKCQKIIQDQKKDESVSSSDTYGVQTVQRQIEIKLSKKDEKSITEEESISSYNETADVRFEPKLAKKIEKVKTRQLQPDSVNSSLFDNEDEPQSNPKQKMKSGIIHATNIENPEEPEEQRTVQEPKKQQIKTIDLVSSTSLTQSQLSSLSVGDEAVVRAEKTVLPAQIASDDGSQITVKNANKLVQNTIPSVVSAKDSNEEVAALEVGIHPPKQPPNVSALSNIHSVKYKALETPELGVLKTGGTPHKIKEHKKLPESPVKDNISFSSVISKEEKPPEKPLKQNKVVAQNKSVEQVESIEKEQQTSEINKQDMQMQTQTESLISVEETIHKEPSILSQSKENELSPMKMISYENSDSLQYVEQKIKPSEQQISPGHEQNPVKKKISYQDEVGVLEGGKIKKFSGIQESIIAPHKINKPDFDLSLSNAFSAIQPKTRTEKREQLPEVSFDFAEHYAEPQKALKVNDLVQEPIQNQIIEKQLIQPTIKEEQEESSSYYSYEYSYSDYSEESDTPSDNLKQRFNDLTEILEKYPFFETVYDVCGKCKLKQHEIVQEEKKEKIKILEPQKQLPEYEDPVIIQELRIQNKDEINSKDSFDERTKQQVVVPVKSNIKPQKDPQKFTFKSDKQQIRVQNLQIPIQKANKISSHVVNLPPKPKVPRVDAAEITTFNVKKNPSLKYKEFIINDFQPQKIQIQEEDETLDESETENSQSNDQVEQILTVILKQPQPEADTLSESTSPQQSDILLQSIQESLGISGTPQNVHSITQSKTQQIASTSEISQVSKIEREKTKSLSLSPIPQNKDNKSQVSSITQKESGELTSTYQLSSSIEPGQVYPKVHQHVHNDNYINLEQFSAGEVSGYSEFGVAAAAHLSQPSSSLEQGEIDYLNALKVLGLE